MPVTRADGLHVDAALLERTGDDGAGVDVGRGEDARQRLEQRDLAAHVDEHRRELSADHTAADDRHACAAPR